MLKLVGIAPGGVRALRIRSSGLSDLRRKLTKFQTLRNERTPSGAYPTLVFFRK